MAYPTLTEIKGRLGATGADQDALLQHSLSVARSAVENYCGYRWGHTDSEMRLFERKFTRGAKSVFSVSDPGLLSWTQAVGITRDNRTVIEASEVTLRRYGSQGVGPYDTFTVYRYFDMLELTGVWGKGLEPPAEVAEAVMLVAIGVYTEGFRFGLSEDALPNAADFDGGIVGFLLKGHRRY